MRSLLLALASAAALLAASASPASAADDAAGLSSPGRSRIALFADALREDRVFVSPSLSRIATRGELAALRREVAAMPVPTYVVVAPTFTNEPEGFQQRAALLHDRLGREGVYVVAAETGSIDAAAFGVRTRVPADTAATDASIAVHRREGPFARVRQALREMRTGVRPAAGVEAERRFRRQLDDGGSGEAGADLPTWLVLALAFAGGLALPLVVLLVPHLRRRRAAERAGGRPRLVPADASSARGEGLRALGDLARAIATAREVSPDAQRRYDAASKLLDDRPDDPMALVAAATLARGGRALLGRPPGADWRPCFFDPRHGEGTDRARFRRGTADVPLPACPACAKAIADHRPPDALADRDAPYWERDTAWARTGMGAVDDDLADAVLRGDAP